MSISTTTEEVLRSKLFDAFEDAGIYSPDPDIVERVYFDAVEPLAIQAQEAEQALRMFQSGLTDVLRVYNVPAMPSWAEALHWLAKHGAGASPSSLAPKEAPDA